jgi:hypothetical protein
MSRVGVFILNYMRPDTTPKVVDSVLHQSIKPDVIFVWNNNPKITANFSGCININSQENFRCLIRHAVALARHDIDYWLFIDDDVQLKPKALENFIHYSKKYPKSIIGYYGRNIIEAPGYYSLDRSNWFTGVEKEVDMIMGMVHFCHRDKLVNSFLLRKKLPDMPMTEDDIILSLSNKYIDKQKNYVIPYTNESGPIPMGSNHLGLSAQGGHSSRRKEIVKIITEWAGISKKMPDPKVPPQGPHFKEL